MAKDVVKVSFNLPREELDFLKQLSESRGTNVTQELRRAIATEKLVEEIQEDGDAKLIIDRGGKATEVLFRG